MNCKNLFTGSIKKYKTNSFNNTFINYNFTRKKDLLSFRKLNYINRLKMIIFCSSLDQDLKNIIFVPLSIIIKTCKTRLIDLNIQETGMNKKI